MVKTTTPPPGRSIAAVLATDTERVRLGEEALFYQNLQKEYQEKLQAEVALQHVYWIKEGVMKERGRIIRFFWFKVAGISFVMTLAAIVAAYFLFKVI